MVVSVLQCSLQGIECSLVLNGFGELFLSWSPLGTSVDWKFSSTRYHRVLDLGPRRYLLYEVVGVELIYVSHQRSWLVFPFNLLLFLLPLLKPLSEPSDPVLLASLEVEYVVCVP